MLVSILHGDVSGEVCVLIDAEFTGDCAAGGDD